MVARRALQATTRGGLRVALRPLQSSDIDSLHEAVRESLDALCRWMPWCHEGYSRDEAASWVALCEREWTAPDGNREFGIIDAAGGRVLGCTGLNQVNRIHRFANLGYWVRTGACGRGVGRAVVPLVARYGFEAMGLARVEIMPLVDNAASRRVAEAAGARFEGVSRSRLLMRGEPKDAAMYALVPGDLVR